MFWFLLANTVIALNIDPFRKFSQDELATQSYKMTAAVTLQMIYQNDRHARLPHAATSNTLKHTAAQDAPTLLTSTSTTCRYPSHTATHCNTLQQTATHCNTLQNKMYLVHQHPRRPNAAALSRPADRLRARAVPNHRLCVYLHICIFTYICI